MGLARGTTTIVSLELKSLPSSFSFNSLELKPLPSLFSFILIQSNTFGNTFLTFVLSSLVAMKDVWYHRNVVVNQMVKMLRRGILPLPPPCRLDMQVSDVLKRPIIFIDVTRFADGFAAMQAAIDARDAHQAAATAQVAEEPPAPGHRRRHQVEDDNAGPLAPPPCHRRHR